MAVSSLNEAKASLMQAYRDWKGTPYQLGGASQQGVDCSQLVNIIFDEYFGIELPGNTRAQLNEGDGIRRAAIRTGDLVFFRTGRKTLHVGIAVNSGEFLHASTSNGVMISKLGNSYWRNRFLAARRVL
jgi:cell wall-associated NlpC family hydrolase